MKRLLTIAGSDSGGGAGIQADLKTFAAHGVYGTSAITALTAQNTRGVTGVHAVPAEFVTLQIEAVVGDIGCDAVKTGMLATAAIVEAVAAAVEAFDLPNLVVDPVMVAKGGDRLLDDDAVHAMRSALLRLARVVTPNMPEAEVLSGMADSARATTCARPAAASSGLGPRAVLREGRPSRWRDVVGPADLEDGGEARVRRPAPRRSPAPTGPDARSRRRLPRGWRIGDALEDRGATRQGLRRRRDAARHCRRRGPSAAGSLLASAMTPTHSGLGALQTRLTRRSHDAMRAATAVTSAVLDVAALARVVDAPGIGAVVTFIGARARPQPGPTGARIWSTRRTSRSPSEALRPHRRLRPRAMAVGGARDSSPHRKTGDRRGQRGHRRRVAASRPTRLPPAAMRSSASSRSCRSGSTSTSRAATSGSKARRPTPTTRRRANTALRIACA